jgi:N-succinyldiaminopimelate aminotransferase
VNGAPFQPAVAFALRDPDVAAWVVELAASLARRRDLLCGGLEDAGFTVVRPQGTYFVLADATPLGYDDGAALCRDLPGLAGVVGVPVTAFTHAGSEVDTALRSWVRFTFVKREEVLAQAVTGLHRLHSA